MRTWQGTVLAGFLLLSGCSVTGTETGLSERSRVNDLRKTCIEAQGGSRMDAVDLYGGRLSLACTQWAYQRVRHTIP